MFSMNIRCRCGTSIGLDTGSQSIFPDTECPTCYTKIWDNRDAGVSAQALIRAWQALQSGDFAFTIVFSAIAVECELARVFTKWKSIDSGLVRKRPCPSEEAGWIMPLRNVGIVQRLDRACNFLTGQTFDEFVLGQSALAQSLRDKHPDLLPSDSPRKVFTNRFFGTRDEIVHKGRRDFGKLEGEECFKLALTLFQIISEMDFCRRMCVEHNLQKPNQVAVES